MSAYRFGSFSNPYCYNNHQPNNNYYQNNNNGYFDSRNYYNQNDHSSYFNYGYQQQNQEAGFNVQNYEYTKPVYQDTLTPNTRKPFPDNKSIYEDPNESLKIINQMLGSASSMSSAPATSPRNEETTPDDSPALRALLSKPKHEKIVYSYENLKIKKSKTPETCNTPRTSSDFHEESAESGEESNKFISMIHPWMQRNELGIFFHNYRCNYH